MDTEPITMKIAVDTLTQKVAFAECDKEFADILLSFLTLPLGTIVRLLDKNSSLGCIDHLYRSVENFDAQYMMTEGCRTMLLHPRNSAKRQCDRLHINLEDMEPVKYYTCPSRSCATITCFRSTKCHCGEAMETELTLLGWSSSTSTSHDVHSGVFVKVAKYTISDALDVAPLSDATSIVEKLGITDCHRLEERDVKIGHSEILHLLKRSMLSTTPLTDVLLRKEGEKIPVVLKPSLITTNWSHPASRIASDSKSDSTKLILKLFLNSKRVLYAKCKHDFVDLLFSFLTFPMGFIQSHLCLWSELGCMYNLYQTAKHLSSIDYLKKGCEQLLLKPKLASCFSCKSQLIKIDEETLQQYYMNYSNFCRCLSTTHCNQCPCGYAIVDLATHVDPKIANTRNKGGGYLRSSIGYMVTDELVVTPLSIISAMSIHKGVEGPIDEMEIEVGEKEALALLRATLTSKTALTDAFLPEAEAKRWDDEDFVLMDYMG